MEAGSRRGILRSVAASLAGLAGLRLGADVATAARRKGKKRKRKTPDPNAFGCLNVGQKCRGKDSTCCSGICQGKKPKKGKRDKRKCVGHDEATCQPGQSVPGCGGAATVACTTSAGLPGACFTTTGNAAYCATGILECFPCKSDVDCQGVCGPRATCIPCAAECSAEGGTICGSVDGACTFSP
jgi:hypothetical protein